MPDISQMQKSSFLRKEDCGENGILLTTKEVAQENVAREGAPEEMKWCAFFNECEKPLVLNGTNLQLMVQITGQRNSDNWPGFKVVLYNDPSVSYGGKLTGGIRIRAPKGQPSKANAALATTRAAAPTSAPVSEAQRKGITKTDPDEPLDDGEVDDVPF